MNQQLLKDEVLATFVQDVLNMMDNASKNAVTTLLFLEKMAGQPSSDEDSVRVLCDIRTREMVRLEHNHYFDKHQRFELNYASIDSELMYWTSYAFFFSLVPLIKFRKVRGRRLSQFEYESILKFVINHIDDCCDQNGEDWILDPFRRVNDAISHRIFQRRYVRSALDYANKMTEGRIVQMFDGRGVIHQLGFEHMAEWFVRGSLGGFNEWLRSYWWGAVGLGFLATDPSELPPHMQRKSATHEGAKQQ